MAKHIKQFHEMHLNLNVRGMPTSATIQINELSNELRRQGRNIYKLGLGQSPFPVPEPVVQALRDNAHQKDYLPARGLRELRSIVAHEHNQEFGTRATLDDVLIGPGSKELMFIMQLAYYGDLVVPAPSWVSYVPQAKIIGRRIRSIKTKKENRWLLTPDELEEQCSDDTNRPRILILNYPCNPTGLTFSRETLSELARIARKHKLILLSDEIYGKIHHDGAHQSLVPLYPEGTIFSGGLSKWCGAGGWRLGLFVFPRELRWLLDSMAAVASETYTATSAPIQYAAVRAFKNGTIMEHYLLNSRRILKVLGNAMAQRLLDCGADVYPPEGAFYLFPDFGAFRDKLAKRGIHTSAEMCHQLLEDTGVAILPGSDFGRAPEELTARVAYVEFDGAAALEAADKVPLDEPLGMDFAHNQCGRMCEAAELMAEWFAG